jgi:predicted Rossmann-fold nucleotide-binding protein
MMDPSSTNTATTEQMHEVKIQYCVRMMKNNIEYLGTCVYVLGSTRITNPRSIEICKALGAALAQVKNVTLVTTGFMGAQDMVAKSFLSSLEDIKQHRTGITDGNDNNINDASLASRIVHVLPLKDEKDLTDCCSQNEDGHFEPMSYGKTLFIGESLHERAAVLPRLLDTCILIEGDNETAREVHDFIWNDHFVIPIKSTRGAAAGEVKVPSKVFERPSGVDEMAWNLLSSSEATPAEVAAAVVKVVLGIKQHIVNLRLQQKMKESKSSKSAFKTKLRRSSKKKTGEADVPTIPEDRKQQELPVIRDGEVGDDKDGLEKEISPWKKVKGMMTFSRKST